MQLRTRLLFLSVILTALSGVVIAVCVVDVEVSQQQQQQQEKLLVLLVVLLAARQE